MQAGRTRRRTSTATSAWAAVPISPAEPAAAVGWDRAGPVDRPRAASYRPVLFAGNGVRRGGELRVGHRARMKQPHDSLAVDEDQRRAGARSIVHKIRFAQRRW